MSLDPRPPQTVATPQSFPAVNALLTWVLAADMSVQLMDVLADKISDAVIAKLDARDKKEPDV